jgi:hypothetical protein
MGCDTRLHLPYGTCIEDVGDVIAILLGNPVQWHDCTPSDNRRSWEYISFGVTKQPTKKGFVRTGVTYNAKLPPQCVFINLPDIPTMYGDGWWLLYNFEGVKGPNMSGGSRAERIALHRRLADFFGGVVDYNDCGSKMSNYRRKSPAWVGKTHINKHYHDLQLAKFNLKAITVEEIAACEKFAAYKK